MSESIHDEITALREIIEQKDISIRNLQFLLRKGIEKSHIEGFIGGVSCAKSVLANVTTIEQVHTRMEVLEKETIEKAEELNKELHEPKNIDSNENTEDTLKS